MAISKAELYKRTLRERPRPPPRVPSERELRERAVARAREARVAELRLDYSKYLKDPNYVVERDNGNIVRIYQKKKTYTSVDYRDREDSYSKYSPHEIRFEEGKPSEEIHRAIYSPTTAPFKTRYRPYEKVRTIYKDGIKQKELVYGIHSKRRSAMVRHVETKEYGIDVTKIKQEVDLASIGKTARRRQEAAEKLGISKERYRKMTAAEKQKLPARVYWEEVGKKKYAKTKGVTLTQLKRAEVLTEREQMRRYGQIIVPKLGREIKRIETTTIMGGLPSGRMDVLGAEASARAQVGITKVRREDKPITILERWGEYQRKPAREKKEIAIITAEKGLMAVEKQVERIFPFTWGLSTLAKKREKAAEEFGKVMEIEQATIISKGYTLPVETRVKEVKGLIAEKVEVLGEEYKSKVAELSRAYRTGKISKGDWITEEARARKQYDIKQEQLIKESTAKFETFEKETRKKAEKEVKVYLETIQYKAPRTIFGISIFKKESIYEKAVREGAKIPIVKELAGAIITLPTYPLRALHFFQTRAEALGAPKEVKTMDIERWKGQLTYVKTYPGRVAIVAGGTALVAGALTYGIGRGVSGIRAVRARKLALKEAKYKYLGKTTGEFEYVVTPSGAVTRVDDILRGIISTKKYGARRITIPIRAEELIHKGQVFGKGRFIIKIERDISRHLPGVSYREYPGVFQTYGLEGKPHIRFTKVYTPKEVIYAKSLIAKPIYKLKEPRPPPKILYHDPAKRIKIIREGP